MKHESCPVCGYADMPYPPKPYKICPCCGTEFGVDDYYHTREELRRMWIKARFPWFSPIRRPPVGWSPYAQLIKAGFGGSLFVPAAAQTAAKQDDINMASATLWSSSDLETLTIKVGAEPQGVCHA